MVPRLLLPQSGVVDIFAMHTRLNPPEHRKILHPDTSFVTVVRDPALLYESLYNYFHLNHFYGMTLETFLSQPLEVSMSLETFLSKPLKVSLSLATFLSQPLKVSVSLETFLSQLFEVS